MPKLKFEYQVAREYHDCRGLEDLLRRIIRRHIKDVYPGDKRGCPGHGGSRNAGE